MDVALGNSGGTRTCRGIGPRTVPLDDWAVQRKRQAAQCFRSQFEPHGPDAVLPPFVLERLMAVGEMVFL
ncbi:hypothetical protein IWGMT90018_59000 [Mycobacterium kiyosense]|nr:hypothetical protein IWGMT90018_59000 [Mycobacterium kiyosense]